LGFFILPKSTIYYAPCEGDEMAVPDNPEDVEKLITLYKKLRKAKSEAAAELSTAEEENLKHMADMITANVDGYQRMITKREGLIDKAQEIIDLGNEETKKYKDALAAVAKLKAENLKLAAAKQKIAAANMKEAETADWARKRKAVGDDEAMKELKKYEDAWKRSSVKIADNVSNQKIAIARFHTPVTEFFGKITENMNDFAKTMDTGLHKYTAATGLYSEALERVQVSAMGAFKTPEGMVAYRGIMREIGLDGKDLGLSMQAITKHISGLRTGLHSLGDREVMSRVANLVAGMAKYGVTTEASTKNIDLFMRALKQTPAMAMESTKRLDGLAVSLGIDVNQAIADFNTSAKTLIQYGDRSIDVFAGMAAQAQATGISLANLDKFAQKFDTFDGAANAAGKLNAILGGTHLSVMELVHADPAEKFELIKEAVADAGVAFEDMDRRQRLVIANALDMDVESAARLFGSQEDFQMAGEGMDTAATKQDEMEERIKKAISSTDLLKKSWSELAGPMRDYTNIVREVNEMLGVKPVKALQSLIDVLAEPAGANLDRKIAGPAGLLMIESVIEKVTKAADVIDKLPFLGSIRELGMWGVIFGGDETAGTKIEERVRESMDKIKEITDETGTIWTGMPSQSEVDTKLTPFVGGMERAAAAAAALGASKPFDWVVNIDTAAAEAAGKTFQDAAVMLNAVNISDPGSVDQIKGLITQLLNAPTIVVHPREEADQATGQSGAGQQELIVNVDGLKLFRILLPHTMEGKLKAAVQKGR